MELILKKGADENTDAIEISDTVYNAFPPESKYHIKNNDKITITESFFSDDKKVPDCIRYLNTPFQKMVNMGLWNESSQPVPDKNTSEGSIVLILESPHVDEYTDKFDPLCPANGKTGESINKYFKTIISKISNERIKDEQIILCNPIQSQTSLNYLHKNGIKGEFKNLRNLVWECLWEENKTKFLCRLKKYKPKVIINACTADLKIHLRLFLNNSELSNVSIYEICHPYSWFRDDRRKIEIPPK